MDVDLLSRLRFLARVVERERKHLLTTDQRVFGEPLDAFIHNLQRAERLSCSRLQTYGCSII